DTLRITQTGSYAVNQHLYYYKSPDKISVKEISKRIGTGLFEKLYPHNSIDAGITTNYYWLIFTLKNEQPTDGTFYFQLHQPWIKLAQLYSLTDTGFKLMAQSGMALHFDARPYAHFDIVFPISLRSQSSGTFLLMVDNRGSDLNILPTLTDDDSFRAEEKKEYLLIGLLTGIMAFSIVINIFLYFSASEKIHLIYTLYVLSMLYWLFSSLSLDFQYLYPNYPFLTTLSISISTSLSFIFMTALITSFLDVTEQNSKFKKVVNGLTYIFFILPFVCFTTHYWFEDYTGFHTIYVYVFISASILLAILYYVVIIEKILQRVKQAWFFLIGEGFIAYGILKYCIHLLGGGLNNSVQSPPSDIQIGLTIEAVIIFMGIIYRYNLYKNDREKLQQSLLQQQLQSMEEIVTAQENERKRIAQDLHDDVGATLSTLLLHISNAPAGTNSVSNLLHSERSISIGKKAVNDLRSISHNLLPKDFEQLGLFRVLQHRVEELNYITNVRFHLVTAGEDKYISELFSITLYRIINELINNIIKHAQASTAQLQLVISTTDIMLMVEDDGTGLDTGKIHHGIGLKNIYSRVEFLKGKITIDSNTQGTSTIIDIPYKNTLHADI
ncbi:MAG: hypothetical protein H7320_10450, partial [Ferruginibacter sp.]|nr:hypothetical protein [Ferruginibacter sp.]